jgi:hypothetical protein
MHICIYFNAIIEIFVCNDLYEIRSKLSSKLHIITECCGVASDLYFGGPGFKRRSGH